MNAEEILKCIEMERQITDWLGHDSNHQVNFKYSEVSGGLITLFLETINPKYSQMFLYHSCMGINKLDVLSKMLEYVKNLASAEDTYTIQWSSKEERGVRTSYFQARNIEDALEKFRYGRDRNKTTIFLVSLNPKS